MRYHVRHQTSYAFSAAVFLEPHIFRFRPRVDPVQSMDDFSLTIDPAPAGTSEGIDLSGNAFTLAWFDGLTDYLRIEAEATVRTSRHNPFDYLVLPGGLQPLPWTLADSAARAFLERARSASPDAVAVLASELARDSGSAVTFLDMLSDRLHRTIDVIVRDEGDPFAPADTLTTVTGSCRDIAVLFVDACRAVGVPARFVSGYQEGDPEQPERYLHAWAEAWIPGAGWRGYDPTLGLVVADRHIAVAAAADPRDASPVQGSFRGSPPSSAMAFELDVRRVDS